MIVAISAVYWDEALILILSPSKTVKIKSKTKLHFYFHLLCALDWGGNFSFRHLSSSLWELWEYFCPLCQVRGIKSRGGVELISCSLGIGQLWILV